MKVIDVSQHQGEIDFNVMRSRGVHTVIARVSMGLGGTDLRWQENLRGIEGAGLHVGAYHLWDSRISGWAQWTNFWGKAEHHRPKIIVLDVEESILRSRPKMQEMRDWLSTAALKTPEVYIYTSYGLWNAYHNSGEVKWASEYKLWVADYSGSEPRIPDDWDAFSLWQYSARGNNCGTYFGASSLDIDLNMTHAEWEQTRS